MTYEYKEHKIYSEATCQVRFNLDPSEGITDIEHYEFDGNANQVIVIQLNGGYLRTNLTTIKQAEDYIDQLLESENK